MTQVVVGRPHGTQRPNHYTCSTAYDKLILYRSIKTMSADALADCFTGSSAADDPVKQWARASADMVLIQFLQDVTITAPKGLICNDTVMMTTSQIVLTHWGGDKMAVIFQTTFTNAFSCMKMYEFWLKFHWSWFLRVQLTIHVYSSVGSDNGLALSRRQANIWTNGG